MTVIRQANHPKRTKARRLLLNASSAWKNSEASKETLLTGSRRLERLRSDLKQSGGLRQVVKSARELVHDIETGIIATDGTFYDPSDTMIWLSQVRDLIAESLETSTSIIVETNMTPGAGEQQSLGRRTPKQDDELPSIDE